MTKYEYRVVMVSSGDGLQNNLNELGAEGFSFAGNVGDWAVILIRLVREEPEKKSPFLGGDK
ncbi:MAG: hypothetical protein LC772_00390 [Chloroflexi bacterium]|nr:hypothetical protein [Chloroflexota bacterium]